jgi:hypothetical protein
VPSNYAHALEAGVEETSIANAETYVANLKSAKEQQGASAPTSTAPGSVATATTKGA